MLLGILECGRNKPEWLAEHGGFADWFPRLLCVSAQRLQYRVWRVDQSELPMEVTECDAWLLTGSPTSVYQDLPWQVELTRFVRSAVPHRPLVGVCYGHQHLHHALGGKVAKREDWGVGVQRYEVSTRPEWLNDEPAASEGFELIALHQDHVVEPAEGTQVYAGNADCPLAVTQIGDNVLTFQPHPEMTPDQAALIYALHRQDMGEDYYRRAIASLALPRNAHRAADWIVRFLETRTQGK